MQSKKPLDPVFIAKKNELASLVKKIGNHFGEDPNFLRDYFYEILETKDIDKALSCFKAVSEMTKYYKPLSSKGVENEKSSK